MPSIRRVINALGNRISGIIIFTLAYLSSIYSFNKFLRIHPEAGGAITVLLIVTSIVYIIGIIVVIKYYK